MKFEWEGETIIIKGESLHKIKILHGEVSEKLVQSESQLYLIQ